MTDLPRRCLSNMGSLASLTLTSMPLNIVLQAPRPWSHSPVSLPYHKYPGIQPRDLVHPCVTNIIVLPSLSRSWMWLRRHGRARVQESGGLVKEEDLCVVEHRPAECDFLLRAPAQRFDFGIMYCPRLSSFVTMALFLMASSPCNPWNCRRI